MAGKGIRYGRGDLERGSFVGPCDRLGIGRPLGRGDRLGMGERRIARSRHCGGDSIEADSGVSVANGEEKGRGMLPLPFLLFLVG